MIEMQFFVVYSIAGYSVNDLITTSLSIDVHSSMNVHKRTSLIFKQIVNSHNFNKNITNRFGFINEEHIVIKVLTRLD